MDDKYDYKRFGCDAKRVGQAVTDILSKDQPTYTVEEIMEGMSEKFVQELEKTIEDHSSKFDQPFYILVLTNKEFWATNVIRNWFVPRQTPPHATKMIEDYPNHCKTLYLVDANKGDITLCWTLPGIQDMNSILKTPQSYDKQLVKWIQDAMNGKLNLDSYSVDSYDWRDF